MTYTAIDRQARIMALTDGQANIAIDGDFGPKSRAAQKDLMRLRKTDNPDKLFHKSKIHRLVFHWTADNYTNVSEAIKHYNDVFDNEGNHYKGVQPIESQANYNWRLGIGVSHTKNSNTGVGGLSVMGMRGAKERPFNTGSYPLTWAGIDAMLVRASTYCELFDIPVTPWSTLMHSEVEPNLGIKQSGKWDLNWLPDMDKPSSSIVAGNILRKRLKSLMPC